MMTDDVSQRLVEQRIRNRIMEEMFGLAKGDECVRGCGAVEYVESFFDWFFGPDYPKTAAEWSGLGTLSDAEEAAVRTVLGMMIEMSDSDWDGADRSLWDEALIVSGWPSRIAPHAQQALHLMLERGRFDEEKEEDEPSTPVAWPPA